ncbi:phosphoribosylanthranilate isomerase [Natronobeatus ordinarius]|uniref:phosphoribosylanthranilate isomerase n=1 Tax=Natronobeatus ordinarius TaxID=2963433 RepID=UPI0020CF634F|nr:phosphoribosylanthranilate isomerase [Natronobeatus ordinarius]
MTRVKVCGVTREADLRAVADAGADAVGVICDVPVETPREVSLERAVDLVAAAPPFLTTVLVTMPSSPDAAIELVETVGPDAIQVHGGLEPDGVASLRAAVGADVLVAVDADDVSRADSFDAVADGLVVDSVDEDGGGGTGETHDWERTREAAADLESPVILAGGLTPGNVADAVWTVEPFAVDVASGVEARGGVKDAGAVEAFVDRATTARRIEEVSP